MGYLAVDFFRYLENHEQCESEADARDGRDLLGEQVDNGGREQDCKRERKTEREVLAAGPEELQVERHPPQAMVLILVAQNQNGERFEDEAPDDAEGVGLSQHEHVAAR